jgi:hypothetical protein
VNSQAFIANWNCRGSYADVACPALVNSGLTAACVVFVGDVEHVGDQFQIEALAEINSPSHAQIVEHIPRRVHPALRPRLPSSCCSVGARSTMNCCRQGSWNIRWANTSTPPACSQAAVQMGLTVVLGRPVSDDSCRLSSLPVMMLNGRPSRFRSAERASNC